jgi:hypothetical protein
MMHRLVANKAMDIGSDVGVLSVGLLVTLGVT